MQILAELRHSFRNKQTETKNPADTFVKQIPVSQCENSSYHLWEVEGSDSKVQDLTFKTVIIYIKALQRITETFLV